MADNRKYYYLKLKEDFFDTDEMKILESMKDGYLYSNILLKLYLKSLSNSGRLMYRNVIPYTPEILATLTGHQVGTVEKALDVFKKLDLIEMLDNGAIYMMDIQNFIGQSSSEADRQREYYNRMKEPINERVTKLINAFKVEFKVTREQIEKYAERNCADFGEDEFINLKGVYKALKDGQAKAEDYFPVEEEVPNPMGGATE